MFHNFFFLFGILSFIRYQLTFITYFLIVSEQRGGHKSKLLSYIIDLFNTLIGNKYRR